LIALAASIVQPAHAESCLAYDPSTVTLEGKITSHWAYGPPNFGEDPKHDAKEGFIRLDLARPICVAGDSQDFDRPERGIRHLEMVYYPYRFLKIWMNGRVSVTGTLFHAFTGHHHTTVLITVTETHLLPQ
jgi:hypothetical protein